MYKISSIDNINKIRSNLFNRKMDLNEPTYKKFALEQYKLLVESAHKIEEERNTSNNIFLAINSVLVTFLTQTISFPKIESKDLILLSVLLPVGVIFCWDWLRIISSYAKINFFNYLLIKNVEEELLPTLIFSLRVDMMDEPGNKMEKANLILKKETLIPIIFLLTYITYFFVAWYVVLF